MGGPSNARGSVQGLGARLTGTRRATATDGMTRRRYPSATIAGDAPPQADRLVTRIHGRALYAAARTHRSAVPAFNVSNLETTQGVLAAAEAARAPVVLQVSPGAIAYAGYRTLTRLVFELADDAATDVVVHLDHCRDTEIVERAIADGYGSVMFDGSPLPYDDNVAATARLVAVARATDERIGVEAELGHIGGRDDTDPADAWASRTTPDEAVAFVIATDLDVLAPNLGNLHRMPDDSTRLDLDHLRSLADATDRPIALHGGSGIDQGQLRAAIEAGVGKVNISSRVTRALAAGIRATWDRDADQLDLRRYLGAGREQVQAMAATYFQLTGSVAATARTAGASVGAATSGPDWTAHDEEPE
jgi:fructose-bisphosphate aldolase class II